MRKKIYILLLALNFTAISIAQTIHADAVDNCLYLKLEDNSTLDLEKSYKENVELNAAFELFGVTEVKNPFRGINAQLDQTYRVQFDNGENIDAFIKSLQEITIVEYAEYVPYFKPQYVPNDVALQQNYFNVIQAEEAWELSTGSANVKIAILDNAVNFTHDDLIDNIHINLDEIPNNGIDDDLNGFVDDVNGYDVGDNDNDPNPPANSTTNQAWTHGTHCAGIAGATTDNDDGIASLGFNCKIIPVKCTANSVTGGNGISAGYEGVSYAIQADANVISMSWGGYNLFSITGENIINAAYANGIVLLAAAGNDGIDDVIYPAGYQNVISVGSTRINDQKSTFSNFGNTIDVMAPGENIYSTISGGNSVYAGMSGTSMACPLAAALCGLLVSEFPGESPDQIKQRLQIGCEDISAQNPTHNGEIGAGRINAFLALNTVNSIDENEQVISLYPNPARDIVNVVTESEINSVQIYNFSGQLVKSEQFFSTKQVQITTTNLSEGIYMLTLNNSKSNSIKFVVNK